MRAALVVVVMVLLAGCVRFPGEGPREPSDGGLVIPTPSGPPLVFGGVVRDAATGALVPDAEVRLDLAQAQPCGRQGVGWTSWSAPVANGTWGPLEVPRPRSDDVAFFLHVSAEGYSPNATFIGPTQARGDIGNLSVLVHPNASVEGRAPPGTLLALDAPIFPRIVVADANGSFAFPRARVVEVAFVAATDVPFRARVEAPARVEVPTSSERGWLLEGTVKGPTGAPASADVVAWNGSTMWSVARAGDNGVFALPLPPVPADVRVDARTADGAFGGTLVVEVRGPPALRETVLLRPLC